MNSLEQFQKRLKGLLVKRPGLAVGVWGEAGIGKTHTVQKLLHETACQHLSVHATLKLSDLARALPKPKKLPVWATRILEKLEHDEVLTIEQSTSAFGAVFSGIAPFVLYLEDIHEASPERLEWIVAMAKVVSRLKGVALIVTSRSQPPEPFETIQLGKLEFEAVKTLLETEARASLPAEALEWIHGKAAGNPLFTVEFFRFLARLGFVWNDGQSWRWREPEHDLMPVTVEAILEQSLNNAVTTPELEVVLAAKALLGLDCSDKIWAEVSELQLQEFLSAKSTLQRNGVLFNNEFIHPLYQEIYKQRLAPEQRLSLARRCLRIFETLPQTQILFVEDANLEAEQSLEILLNAASQIETRGENLAAANIRIQALGYATGETKNQLALDAARGLMGIADQAQTLKLLEQAASSFNPEVQNNALVLMAEHHARANRRDAVKLSLERLPQDYQEGRVWFAKYIHILFDSNDFDAVIEYWDNHPEHHPTAPGVTVYHIAYAFIDGGEMPKAKTLADNLLERPNLSVDDRTNGFDILSMLAFYQGHYQEAEVFFTQLLGIYELHQLKKNYSNCLRNRAVNRLQLAQYVQSLPDFEESIRLDFERGMPVICAQTKVMASAVYLEFGQFEQAEQVLQEALEVLKPIPAQAFLVYGLVGLSLLYLRWQPAYGALLAQKYASESLQAAQVLQTPVLQANAFLCCSEVETQTGNPQRGLEYAEQSLVLSKQIGFSEATMSAHLARGSALSVLGRTDEALKDFNLAQSICLETGLKLEFQKTLLEIDRLKNDLNAAKQRLDWFETNGFVTAANTTRSYFPTLNLSIETPIEPQTNIVLEVLGTLQIELEGKLQTIRGAKRQEFLALLLEARIAGRTEVNRLELLDTLYPNEPEDRSSSSLKELVRGTRSSLSADVIQTTTGGYALGNITSDAEKFLKTGNSSLWRGAYLQGIILEHGFESVSETLSLALFNTATTQLESNPKEAARVSRILLEMDSYNLAYLRLCVQALRSSGNHKSLTREYAIARARFLEVGEILPERWQDFTNPESAKTA